MTYMDSKQAAQQAAQPVEEDGVSEEREPTAAEVLAWRRGDVLLPDAEAIPEEFPRLNNLSAGFLFDGVVRPVEPTLPEYVALSVPETSGLEMAGAIGRWNMLWEAAQFRRRFFDLDELPRPMAEIAELGDVNVTFVPRTRSRYFEYAPLMHLLPKRVLDMFGLPTLRRGLLSAYDLTCRSGYDLTCRSRRGDHGMGSAPVTRLRRSLSR